ncbi:MAG TPA: alpha/beta fold hydrolase [Thermoanaerobaculia bacterium]|jgi:alpha-beta hydrolase superfamily lysophospholipase|nr:alpha/beta fold hydrolase [Thermoanaerobaculia bacterium]
MPPPTRRLLRLLGAAVLILFTVLGVRAFDASHGPDLKPWHREAPRSEPRADEIDRMTLPRYLQREAQVIRETRAIEARTAPADRTPGNRYFRGSLVNPGRFPRDWNRTFEVEPEQIRGGALLIHGLSDSPYSLRPLAETLRRQGFYSLCLRMPGHGTVPGALARAEWEDWLAAVRLGARHVRGRAGEGRPFVLVGYSNGGALVVKYALDALDASNRLPRPDRLLLLSPMIGVTRLARLSPLLGLMGALPGLEKARWQDVVPEYNPFKYNSFPAFAAQQSHELTTALDEQLAAAAGDGRIAGLPPILTFQSLADATVILPDLTARLYDRLTAGGSELVLFDLNRRAYLRPLLRPALDAWLAARMRGPARPYTLSLVTNAGPDTSDVVVRRRPAGSGPLTVRPLGLSWPPQVYSLSHVAIPFPPTDPLYGIEPDPRELYGVRLGALTPRGERQVLAVPIEDLMRMRCNPFFPYVERRVEEWIGAVPR